MKNKYMKSTVTAVCILLSSISYTSASTYTKNINRDTSKIEKIFFRPNCPTNVNFKYNKPTHKVENYKDIQRFTNKKLKGGQKLGGQTRYSGLTWSIARTQKSCGQSINFNMMHRSHIRVIMPNKNSMSSCNYNTILKHEMEHVKIYQETPKQFETKIKNILIKYSGPELNKQLARISNEISVEMKRRNDKFHDDHGSVHTLKKYCFS